MSAENKGDAGKPRVALAAGVIVLSLPTAIAFFSGGYFPEARIWSLIAAWVAFLLAAMGAERPLPSEWSGRLFLGGLLLLVLLTATELSRAPIEAPAVDDLQRLLIYLPFAAAAVSTLDLAPLRRWTVPALLGGLALVCIYGLSGRLLPSVIGQVVNADAGGRLNQPVSYWNAMGVIAAMAVVLAVHLTDSSGYDRRLRLGCAALLPWLAVTLSLTVSRGAIAAAITGLLALIICTRNVTTLRISALAAIVGVLAAAATLPLEALRTIGGTAAQRNGQGLLLLAVLIALSAVAVLIAKRIESSTRTEISRRAGHGLAAVLTLCVIAGFVIAGGGSPQSSTSLPAQTGAKTTRLASVQSSRGAYWEVALNSFFSRPLLGEGPASFRVTWLRERPFAEAAKDAHSLYLETAAELGLLGLLALALIFAGVVSGSLKALAADRAAAAGPVALLAAWALHAGLDWDWEMPAVTLVALAAAGFVVALGTTARP